MGISIWRKGGRPRFLGLPPNRLEIGQISRSLDDLKTTVSFLSKKYDDLLGQYNRVAEKQTTVQLCQFS